MDIIFTAFLDISRDHKVIGQTNNRVFLVFFGSETIFYDGNFYSYCFSRVFRGSLFVLCGNFILRSFSYRLSI